MPEKRRVLDASVVLAVLKGEPGGDRASGFVTPGANVSAVNVAEVLSVLSRGGMQPEQALRAFRRLGVTVLDFTIREALLCAAFYTAEAEARRLSLGDRACLATAAVLDGKAITADRSWRGLAFPVEVDFVR